MAEILATESILDPPPSVMRIAEFLKDLADRRIVHPEAVGEAWKRHGLTGGDARQASDWLNAGKAERKATERVVKTPEKRLAQPDNQEDETGQRILERSEPPVDIHLWQALFNTEPGTGTRRKPSPSGRFGSPMGGTAGELLHATLALTYQGTGMPGAQPSPGTRLVPVFLESAEELQPQGPYGESLRRPITNGVAAASFGQRIADSKSAGTTWNEPFRRDLLPVFAGKDMPERGSAVPLSGPQADPLYGQITLLAPPMTVANSPGQGAGVGLKLDWRDLARGTGPVDESSFETLARSLPPGARALYPAMDPRSLTRGAVNLRLAPTMIQNLVSMGYGAPRQVDAYASARMAADYYGGTPVAQRLPALLEPLARPGRRSPGTSDLLPQGVAGNSTNSPNRGMRFLDYMGLPIFLSPTLNVHPDLDQEMQARISTVFMPRAPLMSPLSFSNLRNRLFGSFQSVDAKPDQAAWRRVAPDYDRSGAGLNQMVLGRLAAFTAPQGLLPRAPMTRGSGTALAGWQGAQAYPAITSRPPTLPGSMMPVRMPLIPGRTSLAPSAPPSLGAWTPTSTARASRMTPAAVSPPSIGGMFPLTMAAAEPPAARASAPISGSTPITIRPTLAPRAAPGPPSMSRMSRSAPSAPVASRGAGSAPSALPRAGGMMPAPALSGTHGSQSPMHPQTPAMVPMQLPHADDHVHAASSIRRSPQMQVAPRASLNTQHSEPLAVQTSLAQPTIPGSSGGGGGGAADSGAKKDSGMPGSEINLLASEVWSLLKRRLAFESQRMGRH